MLGLSTGMRISQVWISRDITASTNRLQWIIDEGDLRRFDAAWIISPSPQPPVLSSIKSRRGPSHVRGLACVYHGTERN